VLHFLSDKRNYNERVVDSFLADCTNGHAYLNYIHCVGAEDILFLLLLQFS